MHRYETRQTRVFLAAYGKNEKGNLSMAERNAMRLVGIAAGIVFPPVATSAVWAFLVNLPVDPAKFRLAVIRQL